MQLNPVINIKAEHTCAINIICLWLESTHSHRLDVSVSFACEGVHSVTGQRMLFCYFCLGAKWVLCGFNSLDGLNVNLPVVKAISIYQGFTVELNEKINMESNKLS